MVVRGGIDVDVRFRFSELSSVRVISVVLGLDLHKNQRENDFAVTVFFKPFICTFKKYLDCTSNFNPFVLRGFNIDY